MVYTTKKKLLMKKLFISLVAGPRSNNYNVMVYDIDSFTSEEILQYLENIWYRT